MCHGHHGGIPYGEPKRAGYGTESLIRQDEDERKPFVRSAGEVGRSVSCSRSPVVVSFNTWQYSRYVLENRRTERIKAEEGVLELRGGLSSGAATGHIERHHTHSRIGVVRSRTKVPSRLLLLLTVLVSTASMASAGGSVRVAGAAGPSRRLGRCSTADVIHRLGRTSRPVAHGPSLHRSSAPSGGRRRLLQVWYGRTQLSLYIRRMPARACRVPGSGLCC